MGKKAKIGKARKDKYYKLAKETGYRSRAAFKLIQLNRKYSFLQNSRVVLDLCAAPGGWLQVAAQNTPLSSIIIGIDLVPIQSIRRVVTLQADITTDKCSKEIKKNLKQWNVDCVLHDGAPNVGQSWAHDAYQQATLSLAALKLCTLFLKKGGWFITKLFRSKDYNALQWVFQQLFHSVHSTKPQASRAESAEIYIVCQGYLAPDKIDNKFLDAKHVFKEIDQDRTKLPQLNLRQPNKLTRQSQGYPEGEHVLRHTMTVSEFFTCSNHMERLADVAEIVMDDEEIANHELTTEEIRELCKDIKVLGKHDIRHLVKWRTKYLAMKEEENKADMTNKSSDVEQEEDSDAEEVTLDKEIEDLQAKQASEARRKLKKVKLEKQKLKQRMVIKSSQNNQNTSVIQETEIFHLRNIKTKEQLSDVAEGDLTFLDPDYETDFDLPSIRRRPPPQVVERGTKEHLEDTDDDSAGDENDDDDYMNDDNGEIVASKRKKIEESSNPLVVDLEDKTTKSARLANDWFSKDSFAGVEDERDEDIEMDMAVADYRKKGGTVIDDKRSKSILDKKRKRVKSGSHEEEEVAIDEGDKTDEMSGMQEEDVDDYSDSDEENARNDEIEKESALVAARLMEKAKVDIDSSEKKAQSRVKLPKETVVIAGGFEIVPAREQALPTALDEVGLALGAAIASSRKRRREIIEDGFNRYNFDDDNLPSWFAKEEQGHRMRPLPITKEEVREYRERQKEIDARPIKKIAEAKARKKRRQTIKLMKARKRSEALSDAQDVSEKEKWSQIKQIYKKAGLLTKNKKEVTYVVAKKGAGRKQTRPPGVKGHYKVVDPRGKKDKRGEKMRAKKNKGKTHRHSRK